MGQKKVKINEIGTLNRGRSRHRPRNDASLYGGEYPFVQTGDVKAANFYLRNFNQTYNDKGLAQSKIWPKGTLLITIAANIAETAILDIDACFPDSIIGFIPHKERADVRYIKYFFDYIKLRLQAISRGTTQDNMSMEKLLSMPFNVHSFAEQKKIANILFSYDELIDNNNQRISLLEQMAEEMYKEWFVRLRFPGHEQTRIVDGVPEGWEIKTIKEIVDRKKFGKIYRESYLSDNGEIIVIDQSRKECLGYYNGEPQHEASPEKPMILFGDHTCKMVLMVRDFSLAENVIPFAPIGRMPVYFLFHLVKNKAETKEYKRHWTDLTTQRVRIPSNDLQLKYSAIVLNFYQQIELLKGKNKILKQTRDLLLPRLMSGKLSVDHLLSSVL